MSLNLEYLPLFIFVLTLTYKKKRKRKRKTKPNQKHFGVGGGTVRQPTCHTVAWGLGPAMLLHPGPRP